MSSIDEPSGDCEPPSYPGRPRPPRLAVSLNLGRMPSGEPTFATGRPRRRTNRARLSRRRWRTWSRTRSKPPMRGRTCSSGGDDSWTTGRRTLPGRAGRWSLSVLPIPRERARRREARAAGAGSGSPPLPRDRDAGNWRDALPGDDRPVEIGRVAMHENDHRIIDGEHCRPVPPAPRGHAAAGQQEPAAASRLVVRPVCGPGSLPARMHEDGSDPPNGGGGVAPVLSLAAGAVRIVRSRTKNPNSDSEKWKRVA